MIDRFTSGVKIKRKHKIPFESKSSVSLGGGPLKDSNGAG